jgi:hypothetical protein
MAREIAETPVLRGQDAKRFREAMASVEQISKEERKAQREAYEWFKSIATFPLP